MKKKLLTTGFVAARSKRHFADGMSETTEIGMPKRALTMQKIQRGQKIAQLSDFTRSSKRTEAQQARSQWKLLSKVLADRAVCDS